MYQEVPPFRVKKGRFANGERIPILVDALGVPTFRPNLYGVITLRGREGAAATIEAHYRAIAIARNWAASRQIDLEGRADSLQLLDTFEIEDLRDALRLNYRRTKSSNGERNRQVGRSHYRNRCIFVKNYLSTLARDAIHRLAPSGSAITEARHRLERFERIMAEGLPKAGASEGREGLSEETQEIYLEIISPGHPLNPFQDKHHHRNYALLRLYFETSVRRAEALVIKGEHLADLGGSEPSVWIVRDPDSPDDPRIEEPRVKTNGRVIPISVALADSISEWLRIRSDSSRYPGAKKSPYVFVARSGKPLGLRTVNNMFELLRRRIDSLPKNLTPHALRHTGNDRFSEKADELGWSEAEERQARNYHFGWSKKSKQGEKYSNRHIRRKSEKIIRSMQEKSVQGKSR